MHRLWLESFSVVCACVCICVCACFDAFETPTVAWSTRKTFGKKNIANKFQKVYADKLKMSMFKDECGHTHKYWYWKSRYIKTCNDVLLRTQKRSDPTVKFSVVYVVVLLVQFREQKKYSREQKCRRQVNSKLKPSSSQMFAFKFNMQRGHLAFSHYFQNALLKQLP